MLTKEKYTLGIIYKKTNTFWKIDYFRSRMKSYDNLIVKEFDLSDFNNSKIPDDLEIIILIQTETERILDFIENNKNLKWIHCMSAGVEKLLNFREIFENDDIILTNARGAFAEGLAEYAIFSMLYFSFNASNYLNAYKDKKWVKPENKLIKNKTLTIVGYGLTGIEIARKAKYGFDMKVLGVKKNIENFEGREFIDEIHTLDDLDEILPRSDFVLNLLPQTNETINLFDYEKFKKMKRSSVFINLGRGSAVDEDNLIKALKENLILGAALDVFKTEPLPSNSPFYDLDNALLSFHSCYNTDEFFTTVVEDFLKNLNKYLSKGEPISIIDKKKGY